MAKRGSKITVQEPTEGDVTDEVVVVEEVVEEEAGNESSSLEAETDQPVAPISKDNGGFVCKSRIIDGAKEYQAGDVYEGEHTEELLKAGVLEG